MILLEYTRERVLHQFSNFFKNNKTVIDKFFHGTEEFLSFLERIDPYHGSEIVTTIISLINRKVIDFHDITSPIEYSDKKGVLFRDFLIKYEKLKKKHVLSTVQKDLKNIEKRDDLIKLIKFVDEYKDDKDNKNNKGRYALIFTGKNGSRFVESYDETHACYIGRGTLWCTASTKSENQFNVYKSLGYRIITILPKSPGEMGREKYQFNLWSLVENYGEVLDMNPVQFKPTLIFDYLNNPVNFYDLPENIFKDFVDFIFFTFSQEIEIYYDLFGPKVLNYDELYKFITNGLEMKMSPFLDYIMILINTFIKDGMKKYTRNFVYQINEWLKDRNIFIFSLTQIKVIPFFFELLKIIKCIELMVKTAESERENFNNISIETDDESIIGSYYDIFLFSALTGNLTIMINLLEVLIRDTPKPYSKGRVLKITF